MEIHNMISVGFFILACFFNSIMDAVENENFHESVFKKLPVRFYYKRESWKYAPKLFGYKFDAWHISKSCMIICFILTAIFFDWPVEKWQDVALYLVVGGVIWNGCFWLFYHKLFGIK